MCEGGAELNLDCLSIREFLHEERTCAWSVHLYVPNANAIPGTLHVFHKAFVQWKGSSAPEAGGQGYPGIRSQE